MADTLATALAWTEAGRSVALATVASTWGSAPRRPGATMCVSADGEFEGSVSGGCVETAVVEAAQQSLESREPRLLEFGVTNDLAWEVGLACGGSVDVWVQPSPSPALLSRMVAARARGGGGVLAIDLVSAEMSWFSGADRDDGHNGNVTESPVDPLLEPYCVTCLRTGESSVVDADGHRTFLHALVPPLRVVIVGAVHIAQALAPMVIAAGYEVVVVDPRGLFATEERFPGLVVVRAWPAEAFMRLGIDSRTAVVALTHDPKFDDPALSTALRAGAAYVGALGSRRTHAKRVTRLEESGLDPALIQRIRAPVGLDLGGRRPGEIAAAILAEIVRDTGVDGLKQNERST